MKYQDFNDASFDALVEATMAEFKTPGMAILMVHKDGISAKGYGYPDISQKTPMTPHTLFYAASTTKSFTSALAADLVESKDHPTINWDTPLANLIRDDFVLDQSTAEGRWATDHITIEDALSHRTGLSRHDMIWKNGIVSNRDIVRALRHVPITSQLRSKFEYANNPFTAVAHAVSTVCDRPFGDLLKQNIFDPLNMKHTSYSLDDAKNIAERNDDVKLARSYLWDDSSQSHQLVSWNDLPPPNGAGGIISNVLDYSRWVQHLMQPSDLSLALSKNAVKAMRSPRIIAEPDQNRAYVGPQAYCLGLFSHVYRGREVLEHGGAIGGYMTEMLMVPPTAEDVKQGRGDSGWAVVVMQNTYSSAAGIVVSHLLDEYLQTPVYERSDRAKKAKETQAKREEAMLPENVMKRLFGFTSPSTSVPPAVGLESYAGIYSHPVYHKLKITAHAAPEQEGGRSNDGSITSRMSLRLRSAGETSCVALVAELHHVNAEWWWAYAQYGPRSWILDDALKLQFVVGPEGKVEGMRFQAEDELEGKLAFFEKIE